MEQFPVVLRQFVEAAPAGVRRWHRVLGQPSAAGIMIEVFTRLAGLVKNRDVHAMRAGLCALRSVRSLPGTQQTGSGKPQQKKHRNHQNEISRKSRRLYYV